MDKFYFLMRRQQSKYITTKTYHQAHIWIIQAGALLSSGYLKESGVLFFLCFAFSLGLLGGAAG